MQDVPHGHAVRVQADDHVIQAAGDPPGPLGHQQRLEAAGPVPRHRQAHRAHPGLHRLGDGAVAVVPVAAAAAGPVVPLIAQVRGQLRLQRPLQHRPDQLAEHRPLPGQPHRPPRPSTGPAARPAAGHPSAAAAAPVPPARQRPPRPGQSPWITPPLTGGVPAPGRHRAAIIRQGP